MKAVILAGGHGSRLSEETGSRPKPLVEIGGKPILWHIMKIYSAHGINDFVICLGYKGYMIKEFFANYFLHMSDVTIDVRTGELEVHQVGAEPWRVTLVDTGAETGTGGRLKRVLHHVADDDVFCFTYGDGVGDVDIKATIDFHRKHGKLATVTVSSPPHRFGVLNVDGAEVKGFQEKPEQATGTINAGFFVLSPKVDTYIEGDRTFWEQESMNELVADGQLAAYHHDGFWQPMDTLREKQILESMWNTGKAKWKTW